MPEEIYNYPNKLKVTEGVRKDGTLGSCYLIETPDGALEIDSTLFIAMVDRMMRKVQMKRIEKLVDDGKIIAILG